MDNKLSFGALFDFNGTIIFDGPIHDEAWNSYIEKLCGRTITNVEFREHVYGKNIEATLAYFLNRTPTLEDINDAERIRESTYRELCLKHLDMIKPLAKGITTLFDALTHAGVAITIATASPLINMEFFFDLLDLDRWFSLDLIAFNDHSFPGKPEPDIFLLAAQKINTPIECCTVFEDSPSGLEAARRSGAAHVVAVASEFDKSYLAGLCGVELVIDDYSDVNSLVSLVTHV